MRGLVLVFWLLLCSTLFGQFEYVLGQDKPNLGQAIGQGAVKVVADLEARIAVLEKLTTEYTPTYTWPGHNGPQPFEKLREHLRGENIHAPRDVSKWTNRELAFVHDCDHIEELLANGKPLPVLKDQRLRDWLRSKSPAKAVKNVAQAVRKLVIHSYKSGRPCQWCDKAKSETGSAAKADGVEVSTVNDLPDDATAPQIEVCTDNSCRRLMGFVPWSTIKAMMNKDVQLR